jgi:hypothetical protein
MEEGQDPAACHFNETEVAAVRKLLADQTSTGLTEAQRRNVRRYLLTYAAPGVLLSALIGFVISNSISSATNKSVAEALQAMVPEVVNSLTAAKLAASGAQSAAISATDAAAEALKAKEAARNATTEIREFVRDKENSIADPLIAKGVVNRAIEVAKTVLTKHGEWLDALTSKIAALVSQLGTDPAIHSFEMDLPEITARGLEGEFSRYGAWDAKNPNLHDGEWLGGFLVRQNKYACIPDSMPFPGQAVVVCNVKFDQNTNDKTIIAVVKISSGALYGDRAIFNVWQIRQDGFGFNLFPTIPIPKQYADNTQGNLFQAKVIVFPDYPLSSAVRPWNKP